MKSRSIQNLFQKTLLILLLTTAFFACKDEDGFRPRTISDIVQSEDRFSILRAVLTQGGMSDALRTGSFTFFAPNDDAFKKMSINDPGQIGSLSRDSLRTIIQYLVLEGLYESSDFEAGNKKPFRAFDNNNLFITKDATRFVVNMANVVDTDIIADNGIVHVLDHVPSASNLTIAGWIGANPSFSFLSAMATRAAAANPELALQLMSENASFTLFAPTNDAFIASGFSTINDITEADPVILATILTAHILRNAYFTPDFTTGQIGTIGNQQLLIAVNGKITVAAEQNSGTLPTISRSDILTKNGVIHVLDKVLIP